MKSMEQMQQEVDDYISQFKAGYFSPLANLARMTEEVGELAREINHHFGEKKKKDTEEDNTYCNDCWWHTITFKEFIGNITCKNCRRNGCPFEE